MNRLVTQLHQRVADGRKILSLFLTAGYPSIESTVSLTCALAETGADVIEIGIPFSDPIADGPTIQQTSAVSLNNGTTLHRTFELVADIRRRSAVPLVLMGYTNSVIAYGPSEFFARCVSSGVDGMIISDLPLEESGEFIERAEQHDICMILLAAPTTSPERLHQLDEASNGFLYYVSLTGVTGVRPGIGLQIETVLPSIRQCVHKNPLLVGFGISAPDDAVRMAHHSDGVVIGSALVKHLINRSTAEAIEHATAFTRSIRSALDSMQ
jgi:tryptophan synthase alpha chain